MRLNRKKIINFLLPGDCALCNSPLNHTETGICKKCSLDIIKLPNPCLKCGMPISDKTAIICGNCLKQPPLWQQAQIPFSYQAEVKFLLKSLKFNRKLELVNALAQLFLKNLPEHYTLPDAIIPVPLGRNRIARRGFNQAREVSLIISHELKIPLLNDVLIRHKNTKAQTYLNAKERKINLKNAFRLKKPESIKNKYIVLFDDIFTTGATLNALTKVCRGTGRIDIWCMAKTL